MCEIMDLYTSRSVWIAFAGSLNRKYERYNHEKEKEHQIVGPDHNEIFQRKGVSAQTTE